jgi:hypothetical protein
MQGFFLLVRTVDSEICMHGATRHDTSLHITYGLSLRTMPCSVNCTQWFGRISRCRTSVPLVGQGDRRVRKRLDPSLPSIYRSCRMHVASTRHLTSCGAASWFSGLRGSCEGSSAVGRSESRKVFGRRQSKNTMGSSVPRRATANAAGDIRT